MRTISIYKRAYINIECEGIIYACLICGTDTDAPYFLFDGARHELTKEECEILKGVMGK